MKAGLRTLLDGTYITSSKEKANSKTLIDCASNLITKEEKKSGNKNTTRSERKNGVDKRKTSAQKPSENTKGKTSNRKHEPL